MSSLEVQQPPSPFPALNADGSSLRAPRATHTAEKAGLISHGEHAEDLILIQAALPGSKYVDAFLDICRSVSAKASSGSLVVNEKFDGSPSVVFGFTGDSEPFVAYKGGLTRIKGGQRLFRTEDEVRSAFKPGDARIGLYTDIVRVVLPRMKQLREEMGPQIEEFLWQGDLLFHPSGDKKRCDVDGVRVKPNTLTYHIAPAHPLFEQVYHAEVGLVLHTVARRVIEGARIEQESHVDSDLLVNVTQRLSDTTLLAAHPFSEVSNAAANQTPPALIQTLHELEQEMASVGDECRDAWGPRVLPRFRVFLNSGLQPGADGGVYRLARSDKSLAPDKVARQFRQWIKSRIAENAPDTPRTKEMKGDLRAFNSFLKNHKQGWQALVRAYGLAIKAHHLVDQQLAGAIRSKLGGGDVEGLMFQSGEVIVKWVDRLHFTVRNNENWRGDGSRFSEMAQLPEPFESWKPGMVVIPMKLQPPHNGHIEMLRRAVERFGHENVVVIASDKAPQLDAAHWKDLKLAERKSDLAEGRFTHPFSLDLRRDLLVGGLGSDVQIVFTSPAILRDYLRRAQEAGEKGHISIGLGVKERAVDRYKADLATYKGLLRPEYMTMQSGEISGTIVREAFLDSIRGDIEAARATLTKAFAYISDEEAREQFINRAVAEYQAATSAARALVGEPKKSRTQQSPAKKVRKRSSTR